MVRLVGFEPTTYGLEDYYVKIKGRYWTTTLK